MVSSLREIGLAFAHDDSFQCAMKINHISNDEFRIRSGYERTIETISMGKLNIKYTNKSNTAKDSIARMVVKCRCNIAKAIHERYEKAHEGKVTRKRNKCEVAAIHHRDTEQEFSIRRNSWYTIDRKKHVPCGEKPVRRNNSY